MIRLLCVFIFLTSAAWAVEPDEMLADPVLEARAQALDDELRCVQCRSESIASSNADWARDARLRVRELIEGGASDQAVLDFFVDRYGDVVLMRPKADGANLILWLAPLGMVLIAGAVAIAYIRRKPKVTAADHLSAEEEAALQRILND